MAQITNAALATLGPSVLRRARWSWVGYGVAAYVALRLARRYNLLGGFPDRALSLIENNARSMVGMGARKPEGASVGAQI